MTDKQTIAYLRAQLESMRAREYVRPVGGQRFDRDDDGYYNPGCGADDTRDSRGNKLRPRVDRESGEPYWM